MMVAVAMVITKAAAAQWPRDYPEMAKKGLGVDTVIETFLSCRRHRHHHHHHHHHQPQQ